MSLLSDIIIEIDTREKNQKRINAVKEWGEKHGAIVDVCTLKLCDYHIEGTFRGIDINLGIEAKSLSDFAGSYQELPDKLARAYDLYTDVGLFIESGSYVFVPDANNFHATIELQYGKSQDDKVQLPLAVFENMVASFQLDGVHVRQLRSEAHFPYAIANLLINIVKPIHNGLNRSGKDNTTTYYNMLGKLPNVAYKRANDLTKHYPNMAWLCGASEESLKQVLGKKGIEVYNALHFHDLETDEWRNGYHMDGTPKDPPDIENEGEIIKSAIVEYLHGFPEGRTSDEICSHFNIETGDKDKQLLLDYIKEAAVDGKITSKSCGLFVVEEPDKCIEVPPGYVQNGGELIPISQLQSDASTACNPVARTHLATGSQSSSKHTTPILSTVNTPPVLTPDTSLGAGLKRGNIFGEPAMTSSHDTPGSPKEVSGHLQLPGKGFSKSVTSPPQYTLPDNPQGTKSTEIFSYSPQCPPMTTEPPVATTFKADDIGNTTYPLRDEEPQHYKKVPAEHRMDLKAHLKEWFKKAHTLQETVNAHKDWQPGRIFDMVSGGEKAGYLRTFYTDGYAKKWYISSKVKS